MSCEVVVNSWELLVALYTYGVPTIFEGNTLLAWVDGSIDIWVFNGDLACLTGGRTL